MNHRKCRTLALLVTGSLLVLLSGNRPAGQVTYEVVADLNTLTGYVPLGGLIKGTDGALYGTTSQGGTGNCGLIYRLAPDYTLSVLHTFQAQECFPVGDLTLGPDGDLYGTTFQGGTVGTPGTVYKVTPAGAFAVLHTFVAGEGFGPYAGLILLPDGLLYGTTTSGGSIGGGTIFRIAPNGAFEKLTSIFGSQSALALGSNGNLYGSVIGGSVFGGAGGVFGITPSGGQFMGHAFPIVIQPPGCPCPEGNRPLGELVEGPGGNFYGTTSLDGPNTGDQGTVFRIAPDSTLTTLHAFSPDPGTTNYPQGKAPWAGVTLGTDGKLYGTATAGGAGSNGGIYRLLLDGTFEWLHSFDGAFSGGNTEARLLEVSPGVFYSVTAGGGIFKLTTAVNAAPVATNGTATTTEDSYVNGLLAATDTNSDALTFSIVSNGSLGSVTLNDPATGAFTYTPSVNVSGVDTFTFQAHDGSADSNTATVTVTVTAVNDAPTAFADNVTTTEDTPRAIVLTAFDVDSPTVTFALAGAPTKGTAVLTNASTGAVTYTPSPNATGVDSFTFQATDGSLTSNLATVTVTITPVNDAPSAQSGVLVTTEGVAANGSMAATDADGDIFTFSIRTPPALGTIAITDPSAGTFLYTPGAGAVGYDTFAYRVTDSGGASTDGIQMIYIVANSPRWPGQTALASPGAGGGVANGASSDARISADGRFVAFASMASNLVAGDTTGDLDVFVQDRVSGAVTRVSIASDGAQGNGVSGMPAISADGRFVAFESEASSLAPGGAFGVTGILVRDRQTGVTTRVGLATGGGSANADSRVPSISGDGRIVAFLSNASNLVANDTNAVADIFVHDRGLGTTTRVSVATGGTQANAASLAPSVSADGRYVAFESSATNLVPGDTNGFRDVFVRDLATGTTTLVSRSSAGTQGTNSSQMAEVSANGRYVVFMSVASNLVSGDNNNAADIFIHDRASGQTDRVSLATGGGEVNAASFEPSVSADGRYVAFRSFASNVVAGDVNGAADVFVHDRQTGQTRRLSVAGDGAQGSASSEAPAISGDGRCVAFGSSAGNLVGGDTNGAQDAFVAGGVLVTPLVQSVLAAGGTHAVDVSFAYPGTAWTATSNAAWLTVTSQSNATGNGTVTYSAATNSGVARTGTLTVALQAVSVSQAANSAPVAVDGSATTAEDTAVSGVLAATEPDGNALVFSIATNGAKGTVVITDAATGAFTYTPNANANGTDTFTFSVDDGSGNSNVATMTVTISTVNDAPVANAGTISTVVGTPVSGTLTATDIDGPSLTFAIVTNGTKGTATVTNAATGAYTYVPAAGQSGVDTFTFRANDGTANSNTAVVTVTIAGNRLPTVSNGTLTTDEDRSATGTLVGLDADGNPLTFSIVSGGTLGTVTITNAAMGRFKYVPNPNANGQDSFSFRVSDGTGFSNVATVAVTIVAINDAPEALDGAMSTTVNTPVSGQLSAADVDAGDTLTYVVKTAPRRGTVVVAADGSFTYTPRSGFVGTDSFTFRVSDGRATSGAATMTVIVR